MWPLCFYFVHRASLIIGSVSGSVLCCSTYGVRIVSPYCVSILPLHRFALICFKELRLWNRYGCCAFTP